MKKNRSAKPLHVLAVAAVWTLGCLMWPGAATAALIDRGGGLIYDEYLNVTFLQDANYALTSGAAAAGPQGFMDWGDALVWADDLVYYDSVRDVYWSDWRLPDANNQDGTPPAYGQINDNELGHLASVHGISTIEWEMAPFVNVQIHYWTSTPYFSNVWYCEMDLGGKTSLSLPGNDKACWAVMDGDVGPAAVPAPGAAWLLGSGLLGLVGFRRKSKRQG